MCVRPVTQQSHTAEAEPTKRLFQFFFDFIAVHTNQQKQNITTEKTYKWAGTEMYKLYYFGAQASAENEAEMTRKWHFAA